MGKRFTGQVLLAAAGMVLLLTTGTARAQQEEAIQPIPSDLKFDQNRVRLGQKLFRDTRMSGDNTVACIHCHLFEHGGADPRPRSFGIRGAPSGANSPTIFNSVFNFRQFWNGGATSLEEQIDRVVKSPKVLGTSWPEILGKLRQDQALVTEFRNAYADGLTDKNIMDAIATYERSLVTPSRFDKYLQGDKTAISEQEKAGFEKFKKYGCVACHQGVNIGGNMFQKFGAMGDYFKARAAAGQPLTEADRGLYNITKQDEDMHVFKVPSLRNVALTAPYFHDASAKTLEEAVDVMFKYQLGRTAPPEDKAQIIKFLHTLTGKLKEPQ